MNFYLHIDWGPRHQFSNWTPQFPAPALGGYLVSACLLGRSIEISFLLPLNYVACLKDGLDRVLRRDYQTNESCKDRNILVNC